jgi:hypothetical protein
VLCSNGHNFFPRNYKRDHANDLKCVSRLHGGGDRVINRRLLILGAAVLVSVALVTVATAFGNGGDGSSPSQSIEGLTALGNGFSFQGRLTDSGNPANGNYDLRFVLYDSNVGGTQVGSTVSLSSVPVANGLFTVSLDFGAPATATATATATTSPSPTATVATSVWDGNARWVEIAVRPAGSSAYTILDPRQAISPAPYALYAKAAGGFAVPYSASGSTSGGIGVVDISGSGDGMAIAGRRTSINPAIIAGAAGVYGSNAGNGAGVQGESTFATGIGVQGFATTGTGGKFTGPMAIELNGGIKVSGTPSAFSLTVGVATLCLGSQAMIIDNVLTNGDSTAMLQVTAVDTTPATLDLLPSLALAYNVTGCTGGASKWVVYNATAAAALPSGMQVNVLVIKQ